jgi:cytochrome b6-f complex iron-sulfur subunit
VDAQWDYAEIPAILAAHAAQQKASLAGWGAVLACFAAAGGAILRLLFPRVLFEPPTTFKAGYPGDYAIGEVSQKLMKAQRVWIIRTHEVPAVRLLADDGKGGA